jgi:Alpha/beta hydrolase domain
MTNIEIQVNAVEPFAEGQAFGEAGPYLRIRGVAKGSLDPGAPGNQVIVDLDKAPRNASGLVEYETDFFILRPADPSRTNGVMVYDVTNRGSKRIFQLLDDAPGAPVDAANDPKTAREAGLGFSLGRGYSLVWSGWDPGAPSANNGLGARFPTAMENGRPVTGHIRHEFHIGTRAPGKGDLVRLSYPAVSTDTGQARLAVRDRESDARIEIPANSWEFADAQSIRLLPQGSLFAPFKIYELWYQATGSKVLGIGFATVRDLVSFLRYERSDRHGTPNPLLAEGVPTEGTGIHHALAFGVSQSGRFLRHFLELGMNDDGRGRRVFDGVMSHVAGAGKVFANHRFGMPGRTATQHEDRLYPENWFPFGNAVTTDPFSRQTGAILQGRPTDPLVIETNSSTEYWQKGASLTHTDPTGRNDADLPSNLRVYLSPAPSMAAAPGSIRAPAPASIRATRTAPPRPCGRCLWRSKNGSPRVSSRRRAEFRG